MTIYFKIALLNDPIIKMYIKLSTEGMFLESFYEFLDFKNNNNKKMKK